MAPLRLLTKWWALPASVISVVLHRELEIEPVLPVVLNARAAVNVAEPKFASGSTRQNDDPRHSDGASTIQSADETSTLGTVTVRVNDLSRGRSCSETGTVLAMTFTAALLVSPGLTFIRIVCDGAGTSSYQTLATILPCALQSVSLPICSSALTLPLKPPSPTQIDEKVRMPEAQVAFCSFHLSLTFLNLTPERWTAYPAQLE